MVRLYPGPNKKRIVTNPLIYVTMSEMCDLRRTQFLNAQLRQPLPLINALSKRLASNKASRETSRKSISSSSCIIDHVLVDSVNWVLRDLSTISNNRRERALCNNSHSLPLLIRLGQCSQMLSNLL